MLSQLFDEMRGVHGVFADWGTALDWNIVFTFVLCLLILTFIGLSLVIYRGRQTEGNALWLHLLGLCVLPVFLLPFGNFTIFEYSKQERFCASCHKTMDPYVNDLTAPDGKSLAASHYQDRFAPDEECYTCHANYGVHGTFRAKLSGLDDAWREFSDRHLHDSAQDAPGRFPTRCVWKCHNGARKTIRRIPIWTWATLYPGDILTDKIRCTDCHVPGHMIKPAKSAAKAS